MTCNLIFCQEKAIPLSKVFCVIWELNILIRRVSWESVHYKIIHHKVTKKTFEQNECVENARKEMKEKQAKLVDLL